MLACPGPQPNLMQDLFTSDGAAPLAERMRPRSIDEVLGQSHLLGPGKPLRVAFESARLHSMILWGPPGVGKTTLARLMADAFGLERYTQRLAGAEQVRLSEHLVDAARSHALGQRGGAVGSEKILHQVGLRARTG